MRAVLALGGLALGTYFLYGGRMAQKEIEKGKFEAAGKCLALWLTLSPATGGEEIKSTADHVKRASAFGAWVLAPPHFR